jgi:hypothetical protein
MRYLPSVYWIIKQGLVLALFPAAFPDLAISIKDQPQQPYHYLF